MKQLYRILDQLTEEELIDVVDNEGNQYYVVLDDYLANKDIYDNNLSQYLQNEKLQQLADTYDNIEISDQQNSISKDDILKDIKEIIRYINAGYGKYTNALIKKTIEYNIYTDYKKNNFNVLGSFTVNNFHFVSGVYEGTIHYGDKDIIKNLFKKAVNSKNIKNKKSYNINVSDNIFKIKAINYARMS